ncbi:kinase-like domain-containing protein [Alternaria rosae]|uniref:kinase-like domain-containing protein n=1 Tax=Alternaria rosae TaxID=1187941 RepID=UPI001E8D9577|nr:kinase-like domain-containing protein [Alternaria rosae]KAH6865218.1 kinase-like domain-containing protein [Alternaria rosae]
MSAMQSDVTQPARAASAADIDDESKTLPSRQKSSTNRLSALIRGPAPKRHRKVLSEGVLLATTPRDPREEVTPRRTRSAVLHSPPDVAENGNTTREEREEATRRVSHQRAEDLPLGGLVVDEDRLGDQLRIALIREPSTERKFLPKGKLDTLVTPESVERELSRVVYLPTRYLRRNRRLAIDIRIDLPAEDEGAQHGQASPTSPVATAQPDKPSYQRIFAILLLMRRPRKIWSFVRERVCDADLPLVLQLQDDVFRLRRCGEAQPVLKCLKRSYDVSQFLLYQWWVLAPFFRRPDGSIESHCKVSENHILPFTKWDNTGRKGGSGQVHKAEVHHDHHAFDNKEVLNNIVAVKKIFISSRGRDAFHELKVLQNLGKHEHAPRHLVKLLATYEQHNHLCLILPWAEMDLAEYWGTKNPRTCHDEAALSTWLKEQCHGLAEAVSYIHRYNTFSGSTMLRNITFAVPAAGAGRYRSQSIGSIRQRRVLFGRHGDIKPKNILWFPHTSSVETSTPGLGILKLSDFGTAHFSDKEFISTQDRNTVPYSRSYQSPECRLPNGELSAQCDVWALGCVFLEFVCWYFGGHELLQDFERQRDTVHGGSCFFVINHEGSAELNPPVVEMIEKLRKDSARNDELLHVLTVAKDDMLVILNDTGDTGHKTVGAGTPTSPDHLKVAEKGKHGRRRSVGNIARELGSTSPSSQE